MRKKKKKKERKKEDDEIGIFHRLVSRLPRTLRYVCKCFCEQLGSINLSACLVWGVVASLVVFLLVHQYGISKFPWPSLLAFSDMRKAQYLVPSNCQTKHVLGFKLGGFTNYPKAYMFLKN